MKKIKFIFPHSGPYRDDVLLSLAHHQHDIDVKLLMYGNYIEHTEWGLKSNISQNKVNFTDLIKIFISSETNSTVFFVPGWTYRWLCLSLIAKIKRNKVICCCDSKKSSFMFFKQYIYAFLFSGFFVSGYSSKNFLSQYFKNKVIVKGVYCLNKNSLKNIELVNASLHKKKASSDSKIYNFVTVANYLPSRKQEDFLKKLDSTININSKVELVFVGSGYSEEFIEMTKKLKYIKVGFQKPIKFNNLSEYIKKFDAVVHSGEEPYSTMLIVAALSKCIIFCDKEVGAYECLIGSDYKNIYSITKLCEILNLSKPLPELSLDYLPEKYLVDPDFVAKSLIQAFKLNDG